MYPRKWHLIVLRESICKYFQVNKKKLFVESEADVTGPPCSSDEENTSGLDDLDESFINDMTQQVGTSVNQTVVDMQARYLQSVKYVLKLIVGS